MHTQRIPIAALLLVPSMLAARADAQGDFVVPSGTVVEYDTAAGPIRAGQVIIEQGGTLRAFGVLPLRIQTHNLVVDGTLDLSGFPAPLAVAINSTNIPEFGAPGGPGAGKGGTGSPLTTASSPQGGPGFGPLAAPRRGGFGGESGYSPTGSPGQVDLRRPGGGGGGALAADVPFAGSAQDPQNIGLQAQRGKNGHPQALGVLSLAALPSGGPMGTRAFLDPDPDNDFFGQKLLSSGQVIPGELAFPVAGAGGGAGGDAINGNVWPPPIFDPAGDEKGAAGGGGGGLGIIEARLITLGPLGLVLCNGGKGGGGENTLGLNSVGGGSGGGSGGYLLMQAQRIDLRQAQSRALSSLGGRGGWGKDSNYTGINAGGNGGPGVIALHMADPSSNLLLPAGQGLEYVSVPVAHVLLPIGLP